MRAALALMWRSAISNHHLPPLERHQVPLVVRLLHWIAVALWGLPAIVWVGWLFGWTTIEPSEMHRMVVGSVFYCALGFLIGWIGELARRGR